MTVSPAKQFYYCFSCGAGGNAIKFLMELQRLSFADVVLELARKYQLPIETLDGPQQERLRQQLSRREQLHRALTLAAGWFRSQLRSPAGASALAYLKESRGLSEVTIEAFGLGSRARSPGWPAQPPGPGGGLGAGAAGGGWPGGAAQGQRRPGQSWAAEAPTSPAQAPPAAASTTASAIG
jgi:DNA primase